MRWSHAVGAALEKKAVPSATKSERFVLEEEEWRETQRACGRESCGTAGGRAVRENAPQKERENGAEKEREERVRRSRARGESSAENRTPFRVGAAPKFREILRPDKMMGARWCALRLDGVHHLTPTAPASSALFLYSCYYYYLCIPQLGR